MGVKEKLYVEFPWVLLGFSPWNFQGLSHNFAEFLVGKSKNSRGVSENCIPNRPSC